MNLNDLNQMQRLWILNLFHFGPCRTPAPHQKDWWRRPMPPQCAGALERRGLVRRTRFWAVLTEAGLQLGLVESTAQDIRHAEAAAQNWGP